MAKTKLEYPEITDPMRATNKWWTGTYDRSEVYGPLWFWREPTDIKTIASILWEDCRGSL